jgi:hypothetical protein
MTETRVNKVYAYLREAFPEHVYPSNSDIVLTREFLTIHLLHISEKLERENPLPTNRLGVGLTPSSIPQHCPCCIRYGNPEYATAFDDYKNLAHVLTADLGDEYYDRLDEALIKAKKTFPDLQKTKE